MPGTPPLLPPQPMGAITDQIAEITLHPHPRLRWLIAASFVLVLVLIVSIAVLFLDGVGIWGINIPVNWGLAILNTVWLIGVAHAGTVISALMLLLSHSWRNSVNRFAEAMAVFAAICASFYPILHLGRPELFYWNFAYPNQRDLWPQFMSPLVWDVFAFVTYLVVSILFWYIGLLPDLASVRDRATGRWARRVYGMLALGWRGSAVHWLRWRQVYRLIAALAIVLVVFLHAAGALLLAVGLVPGWHSTQYPAFFMLGAMHSGFAMVAILAVTLRAGFHLQNIVTARHLDILGKLLLGVGLLTAFGHLAEFFFTWFAGDVHGVWVLQARLLGEHALSNWASFVLAFGVLQALWWHHVRVSAWGLFSVGLAVTVGMWLERYMLMVSGLSRGFLPSAWDGYSATFWEWSLFAGLVGLFFFLFFLFVRFLPLVSIFELKEVLHEENHGRG